MATPLEDQQKIAAARNILVRCNPIKQHSQTLWGNPTHTSTLFRYLEILAQCLGNIYTNDTTLDNASIAEAHDQIHNFLVVVQNSSDQSNISLQLFDALQAAGDLALNALQEKTAQIGLQA